VKPQRVWYVAYGSNVNETRFLRYLQGESDHVGARDATPPRASAWAVAPLALQFAGTSQRWDGGGVAFVDPDPAASAFVRAWDITSEQFEDVFAQENRRQVGSSLDWDAMSHGDVVVGTSWYRRIVRLDLAFANLEQPALTFTWQEPVPLNPPHESYRSTIATGLAENPALTEEQIEDYLAR